MLIGRRKPLTAAQQFINLRSNPVSQGTGRLRGGVITWRYSASPSPLSRAYGIRIDFKQGGVPGIFVEAPDLHVLAGERRIPHLYQQTPPRLCLYLPRIFEWQSWMRLDLTIVPWTALWLFYFEEWLVSDDWKGGGMHPGENDNEEAA
ncbi:MAG: hypothetical protein EOQ50_21625 [Mesorhizobium sp.]|uniref:hypothetical protein n=1 Tax=Mesorhizobium sp. TaxID=1871066 RepID=UPI000FE9C15B|nr:hypothetical protein [Mesorhizobium sp.]RWB71518.1 MAG: hypothetical protein EOQ50_21625 [Mesorhizobium sp.]